MSRTARTLVIVGAAVALIVAGFVLLRPSDDDETTAGATTTVTGTTTATTPAAATTTTTTTETTPAPPPKPKATVVRVEGGQPVGGVKTIEVAQGDDVRIVVRSSDSSGEVHLHGYDVERELAPGEPARFTFEADKQGRYEMELHPATQIAQLDVTP